MRSQVLPPSLRAEEATLLVWAVGMAERGDIDDVGIGRMDAHLADIARIFEAEMRPGLARVGGLVDAVAMRDIAANGGLAHANIDHVGVGGRDGDAADRGALEIAIGDVLPESPPSMVFQTPPPVEPK